MSTDANGVILKDRAHPESAPYPKSRKRGANSDIFEIAPLLQEESRFERKQCTAQKATTTRTHRVLGKPPAKLEMSAGLGQRMHTAHDVQRTADDQARVAPVPNPSAERRRPF